MERYHARYAKVFEFLQLTERRAVTQGYVKTLLGRRRYFRFDSESLRKFQGRDPLDSDLIQDYAHLKSPGGYDAGLLRAAANAPIQGSSADIIKIAMVKLDELLRPYQARLLLQVHDELVFEIPPEEWEVLQPEIKATMESAVSLSVPLVVDICAGPNWMEAKG